MPPPGKENGVERRQRRTVSQSQACVSQAVAHPLSHSYCSPHQCRMLLQDDEAHLLCVQQTNDGADFFSF